MGLEPPAKTHMSGASHWLCTQANGAAKTFSQESPRLLAQLLGRQIPVHMGSLEGVPFATFPCLALAPAKPLLLPHVRRLMVNGF